MLFLVALVVAVLLGYVGASWPGFRPKHVRVVGNVIVSTQEILAQANINPRGNVWLQNAGAIARRVEEIPYVLTARVRRRPPGDVTIAIVERRPFAVARSGGDDALVDASLRVLETDAGAGATLPVLVLAPGIAFVPGRYLKESSARALRDALLSLRAHDVAATEVDDETGDVSAVLPGGVRVLLGDESDAPKAVPLIEPILTRFALLGRTVRTLDLRSPTTPVVTEGSASEPPPVRASPSRPAPRRSL
jgi:cell division protein FtsQ